MRANITAKWSVREINRFTRDGGNGQNVYVHFGSATDLPMLTQRITRARMRNGRMEVKILASGEWVDASNATITVQL